MIRDYHYNLFCYVLGGHNRNKSINTTEIIYPDGSKTDGPIELPEPRNGHCMVEYAGIIILMGGKYVSHHDQFWCNS